MDEQPIRYTRAQVETALARLARGDAPHLAVLAQELPDALLPEVHNPASAAAGKRFSACVFNMETGSRFEETLLYFQRHPVLAASDVLLINEADNGMLRSGNRNVARELADALCMNAAFGVEFITASAFENGNGLGMHGNAILSRFPLLDADVLRLPAAYEWFHKPGDPRLGLRCAVLARIRLPGGPVTLCSVHLENRAAPGAREKQLRFLLAEIDRRYGAGTPALIGGDMNTNTVDGDDDSVWLPLARDPAEQQKRIAHPEAYEPLLRAATDFGYDYESCNLPAKISRRKPVPGENDIRMNLDWFFARGLRCSAPGRVETVFDHRTLSGGADCARFDGNAFSDHDILTLRCEG